MDNTGQKINDALTKAYEALGLAPEEIKKAFENLAGITYLVIVTEVTKNISKEEAEGLAKNLQDKSPEEKQKVVDQFISSHLAGEEVKERIVAETKKVLQDHISYLRSRGDDNQKKEVSQILSEIE